VTGASATNSGLLMLPLMGGLMLTSITSGRIITRTGRYKVWPVTGMAVAAAGMFLLSLMDTGTTRLESSISMLVLGLGIGSQLLSSPAHIRLLPPAVMNGIIEALARSIHSVFLWAIPLLLAGFALSWFLDEIPLRETVHPGQASAAGHTRPSVSAS
jgi:MFS family permease